MNTVRTYIHENRIRLFAALVLCILLVTLGLPDPVAAGAMLTAGMMLDTTPADEILKKALAEHGANVKEGIERLENSIKDLKDRQLDLEQKAGHKPGNDMGSDNPIGEVARLIHQSDGLQSFTKGNSPKAQIAIPAALFKTAISASANSTTGTVNALYAADRRPDIVTSPRRRMTMRDLFTQVPTASGMVEVCKENVFTNNAGPQYDNSSPTPGQEGAVKNESGITFQLSQVSVTTIAHWVPASRQILSDSPMLERYIRDSLLYGLKIEEEEELITGDGTVGKLNGLVNQSTAYTGGTTNQTILDTLAKALVQLMLADYEPSGYVLNPAEWLTIITAKDSQGRYLLGNPADMPEPRLWGLPVVASNSMSAGKFLCMDAPRAGFIADREDAIVRISESHQDFFIRNMVAMLCEERLAFVCERPSAIIYGDTSFAG